MTESLSAPAGRRREKVLTVVLLVSIVLVLVNRVSNKQDSAEDAASAAASDVALSRLEAIRRHAPEIVATLASRRQRWEQLQSGMLEREPLAVMIATMSQSIQDLAAECGVELGQPTLVIDSSSTFIRLRSRFNVRSDADGAVLLLRALETHEPRLRTRSVQLTRATGSTPVPLTLSGTIEVESIVKPIRP